MCEFGYLLTSPICSLREAHIRGSPESCPLLRLRAKPSLKLARILAERVGEVGRVLVGQFLELCDRAREFASSIGAPRSSTPLHRTGDQGLTEFEAKQINSGVVLDQPRVQTKVDHAPELVAIPREQTFERPRIPHGEPLGFQLF